MLAFRGEGEHGVFPAPSDHPLDLDPPHGIFFLPEAELAERNPVLRRPTALVLRSPGFPHRVPGEVVLLLPSGTHGFHGIPLDPGGVQIEGVGRPMIVVRVDHDPQPVGVQEVHVPTAEALAHGLPVTQANADVDGLLVEEDPGFGGLAHRLPFIRIDLGEVRDARCRGPGRFVQPAIDPDGLRGPGGDHHRARRSRAGGRLLG